MQTPPPAARLVTALLFAVLAPRAASGANFSQYPGFAEHFASHPRRADAASPAEQQLLTQYRPRLWIGPEQEGPISFYDDYIAHGRLYDGHGRPVGNSVTPALLNALRDDPETVFVHEPAGDPPTPVAFGRADREAALDLGNYTFLTWHFVFRYSGLPARLRGWQSWSAAAAGDRSDWHQLDHYTAATLAIDPHGAPVAWVLQQHNGLRAYWLGADMALPADGRLRLCAATRSNELYPCGGGIGRHRVVPFMGADYYAPARFLSRALQLVAFRWRENDTEHLRDLVAFLQDGSDAAWSRLAARFRAHAARDRDGPGRSTPP